MKLILSRKAFDSSAGKVANPILDDGSMIPMPIPDKQPPIRYQDVTIAGQNLGSVAVELTNGRARADHFAHLDPDLIESAYPREPSWRPLFGQVDAAQSVLTREGVGPGDLFLFFGWFRRATSSGGRLRYVPGAPDLHVIWGWMQIDEVVPVGSVEHPAWMKYYPHIASPSGRGNTVYTARDKLTLDGVDLDLPGTGVFDHYDDRLRLTMVGGSRSVWDLPRWFAPGGTRPALGFHDKPDRWSVDGDRVRLKSVARGQEFVLDCLRLARGVSRGGVSARVLVTFADTVRAWQIRSRRANGDRHRPTPANAFAQVRQHMPTTINTHRHP